MISENVVRSVLGLYPEENLHERIIFDHAFTTGSIEYSDLKNESEKILVPWQLFFLEDANLESEIAHIIEQREYKVSSKLMAKRKGSGSTTSKRIIDRLIRQQNFLIKSSRFSQNKFCGSLKSMTVNDAAVHLIKHFNIEMSYFWSRSSKLQALEYLIEQVEIGKINVSRGVLTNGILPYLESSRDVYRNTSGFLIKDDKVPFVFLPSEVNPNEVESRQIYTLIYLLVIIGLDQYEYFLDHDFNTQLFKAGKQEQKIHAITSEILLPKNETETLKNIEITEETRDDWCKQFKISPSAFVTTLRIRKIIDKELYNQLLPEPFDPKRKNKSPARTPRVSTSARKFCGHYTYDAINSGIRSGSLANTQAQYLLFGTINKKRFKKYRNELGL